MLVLTRHPDESLSIGDEIEVTVTELDGEQVKLGIQAPREISVEREEIVGTPQSKRQVSAKRDEAHASKGPRIQYRARRRPGTGSDSR